MRLTRPEFYSPSWDPANLDAWSDLSARAHVLSRSAGAGESFDRVVQEAHVLLSKRQFNLITQRVSSRRFARALLTVWHSDGDLARETLRSSLLVPLVEAQTPRLSRLSAITLTSLYLKYFDELGAWESGLFERVGEAARTGATHQLPSKAGGDLIESVRSTPEYFIGPDAPRALASMLVRDKRALPDYLTESGTAGHDLRRFGQLVRREVYLERIRQADPEVENSFLNELTEQSVYEAPDGDLLFGHAILTELALRPSRAPHEQWIKTTLTIGGDPRARHRQTFAKWWSKVDEEAVQRVTRWLSVEDLQLFLHAIEQIGVDTDNDAVNRLFPDRKAFLWGLYELGLVKETRLIVGSQVREELRNHIKPGFRTELATLTNTTRADTTVLAVDCGSFSLIEGSHNVKLWLFAGPRDGKLFDRQYSNWDYTDATEGSRYRFATQSEPRVPFDMAFHYSHELRHAGFWQARALEFLAGKGIWVDPEVVLDSDDYRKLKYSSRFGIPVPSKARPPQWD